jgi:hypothetical protein
MCNSTRCELNQLFSPHHVQLTSSCATHLQGKLEQAQLPYSSCATHLIMCNSPAGQARTRPAPLAPTQGPPLGLSQGPAQGPNTQGSTQGPNTQGPTQGPKRRRSGIGHAQGLPPVAPLELPHLSICTPGLFCSRVALLLQHLPSRGWKLPPGYQEAVKVYADATDGTRLQASGVASTGAYPPCHHILR